MSFHVYIARSGFENTPIDGAEWLAAARQCARLLVTEERDSTGRILHSVHLSGNKRKGLARTSFGLICARDPNRELIVAMFQLAERLNAGVYSEHMKPYASVQDWERRTREYRFHRERFVRTRRTRQQAQRCLWALFFSVTAFAGWIFGPDDTPPNSASLSSELLGDEPLRSELLKGEPLTLESVRRYTPNNAPLSNESFRGEILTLESVRRYASNSAPVTSAPLDISPTDPASTGKP